MALQTRDGAAMVSAEVADGHLIRARDRLYMAEVNKDRRWLEARDNYYTAGYSTLDRPWRPTEPIEGVSRANAPNP